MAQQEVKFHITAYNNTKRAFSSVEKGLRSMTRAASPAVAQMARIGTVAATAATGASIALIKMRMSAVDNLAKTADKLGVTTEALAGFRHAAELSGMSSQQFDKSLQNMGVQIANAAKGTGLAVRALDDLGLNATALSQLPLDQQMFEVAKAMEGVESQSEKTRIAYELFGARGVGVLNMMKGGADGMMAMAKEAETLGIAISRVDAAQIEAANDSVTRAKGVFEGFGNQIATALSPLISELATNFYQSALDMNEAGNVGERVVNFLVTGFGHVANAIKGMKIAVMGVQFVFAKMAQGATFAMSKLMTMIDAVIDKYNEIADVFGMGKINFKPAEQMGLLSEAFGNTADDIMERIKTALNEPLPSEGIKAAYEEIREEARKTAEVVAANAPSVALQTAEAEAPVSKLTEGQKARQEGAKALADFEKKTTAEKTQFVMGQLDAELSGVAKHSRKLFALQKAMQVGQAIMNTYTAATKALASYPPPINAVFAGLAIANGMAQVAQIKAQSFEGGGFTGKGARAGGLDGKGGYMAMVHPNETVIDHTKGQNVFQLLESMAFADLSTKARNPNDKGELPNAFSGLTVANSMDNLYKPKTQLFKSSNLAFANNMDNLPKPKTQSFEGGGFTGYGARAGGLDGKGGYMAMLHPNESVIDHTKGQGQGVTIINNVDASGGGADVDQRIRMAMEVTSQQTVRQVQDLLRRQRLA